MITTVLPKLTNLTTFGCRMDGRLMNSLLLALQKTHPKLKSLVLE